MSITFDLEPVVLDFLRLRQSELGLRVQPSSSTAVFSTGLLDSVALMDLIAAVEQATHQTVDMLRFDPSEVETTSDLVHALDAALSA